MSKAPRSAILDSSALLMGVDAGPRGARGLGHREQFTKDAQAAMLEAGKVGASVQLMCDYAGINQTTFYNWMEYAGNFRADPDRYPEYEQYEVFRLNLVKVWAKDQIGLLLLVEQSARGTPAKYDPQGNQTEREQPRDWRAAAYLLERKTPGFALQGRASGTIEINPETPSTPAAAAATTGLEGLSREDKLALVYGPDVRLKGGR